MLLMALIVGAGFAEQLAFRAAARAVSHSSVIIKPYITARLIQDGPGLAYLERHCPDPAIATCPLFDALQLSDDPWRLTATHIVFETSAQLGSFRLMGEDDQKKVAAAQTRFFLDVLKDAPVATTMAFVRNMLTQTTMFSPDMTIPTEGVAAINAQLDSWLTGPLAIGNLTRSDAWLMPLARVQGVFYALSLMVVGGLVLWPGQRVAGRWKVFAVVLLAGILVNALVCGGISQPASRYGARVIWLLPLAATLLAMAARGRARRERMTA
jgi:hypothetical protein